MKKIMLFTLILLIMLCAAGCKTKTLHCDHCGTEISVKENSHITEEWILFCDECNEKLFDGDPSPDPTR